MTERDRQQSIGPVVLFDGHCNFCNFWVNFLIKVDRSNVLRFASSQSAAGKRILESGQIGALAADTVIVFDDGKFYFKSAATLRVVHHLGGIWKIGYLLAVLPRPLRDWIYDYIARNRYRWFGRREVCRVPSDEDRMRFLE